jgi:putative hydrolase of the HAD superfamily
VTTGESVRAVFWDLGGVILRTQRDDRRRDWEKRLALAPGDLAHLVFDGPMSVEAMHGRASADEVWTAVAAGLGLTPVDRDRLRDDFFAADEVDAALMHFIRRLRSRAQVGLISNAWLEVRRLLEAKWQIADAFRPLILSAEVGVTKPDPRIYRLALEQAAVRPSQAVFVDDFPENVEAAGALGMRTVLFRTSEQAQEEVASLIEGQ